MTRRIIKLKHHINETINHFTTNHNQLPAHINLGELRSCSLSDTEFATLKDIELLLEKASGYGNKMGASTIPTISKMYLEVFTLLPDFDKMTTDIGKSVHRELEAGIKSRWDLTAPDIPVLPVAVNGRLISAKRLAKYEAEKESVNITQKQQDTLLAAVYLDPNLLNDKIWDGETGNELRKRAETLLINELVADGRKEDRDGVLELVDFAPTGYANLIIYTQHVAKLRAMKRLDEFKGNPHLYWKKHKGLHKEVAAVARRFLCIQSTSCEAERVFSRAGYLTTNRKSGLSTTHLRHILFSNSITKALTALEKEMVKAKDIATTA